MTSTKSSTENSSFHESVTATGGVVLPLNAVGSHATVYGYDAVSWEGDSARRGEAISDSLVEQEGQLPRWCDNPAAPQWLVDAAPELALGFEGQVPWEACWGNAKGSFDWPALLDARPGEVCVFAGMNDTAMARTRWEALRIAFALLRKHDPVAYLDVHLWCVSRKNNPLIGVTPIYLETTRVVDPTTIAVVTDLLVKAGCPVNTGPSDRRVFGEFHTWNVAM